MTTLSEAREAIYQRFITCWAETTPIQFDNESIDTPDKGSWVRVSVRHFASSQETLGKPTNRKFGRFGAAFIQIYTVLDIGTATADTLTTQAVNIFEGISLSGTTVKFLDVIPRETGPSGKWYQVVIEANFEYEEIK